LVQEAGPGVEVHAHGTKNGESRWTPMSAADRPFSVRGSGFAGTLEVHGRENEFLLFGSRENFVKVNGNTQRDEKQSTDAGFGPVWWLKGRRRDELGPE
jgi:hypothetical protein